MRKSICIPVIVLFCLIYSHSDAQAFEKRNVLLSLGLGATADLTGTSRDDLAPPSHIYFSPVRPMFSFKAEFAVHKYWGVGIISAIDGGYNMRYPYFSPPNTRYSQVNAQLGLLVNYHFYQLIADKLGRPKLMHADKLDIYTGFTMGAAMSAMTVDGFGPQRPVFGPFMGLHLGARYYVMPKMSVFGEIGIGQSFFSTGLSFKLNTAKKPKVPREF
jgi:hypothetical protein